MDLALWRTLAYPSGEDFEARAECTRAWDLVVLARFRAAVDTDRTQHGGWLIHHCNNATNSAALTAAGDRSFFDEISEALTSSLAGDLAGGSVG